MTLVVADLGWVDFDSDVPSSCPAAQPVLPNPHWPQQNRADIGTSKYKSTQPRSATTSVTLYNYIHTEETNGKLTYVSVATYDGRGKREEHLMREEEWYTHVFAQ